jgi:hypothetical protein
MNNKAVPNSIDWLLETDNVGVRYLAMRDLVKTSTNGLAIAREKAYKEGPIAQVLAKMHPEGYWTKPGPGYSPKYKGTVWSIILLGQLGANIADDERVAASCAYLMGHALTPNGQFTLNRLPSGTLDCLQGNLCAALLDMGCADSRLDQALEWMARSITGEDIAPVTDKAAPVRYYAWKCGPYFACGANNKLSCAWGAVKVMLAFSKVPSPRRTRLINSAVKVGADFLFSVDPATAAYPCGTGGKPSRDWWQFGFPVFYITDLLQIAEALVGLGYGHDSRLAHAFDIIRQKQDSDGRWPMEYDYAGKTWVDFGFKKQPNKWVTLRALRVLKSLA